MEGKKQMEGMETKGKNGKGMSKIQDIRTTGKNRRERNSRKSIQRNGKKGNIKRQMEEQQGKKQNGINGINT